MPNVKGEYDFMYEVFMKMNIAAFFACLIALTTLLFTGCQSADKDGGENNQQPTQTVIELDENNYWKYFVITYDMSNLYHGGKGQFFYAIKSICAALNDFQVRLKHRLSTLTKCA